MARRHAASWPLLALLLGSCAKVEALPVTPIVEIAPAPADSAPPRPTTAAASVSAPAPPPAAPQPSTSIAANSPDATPIPRTPLHGITWGRLFTARSAFATRDPVEPTMRHIWIVDGRATCADAARIAKGGMGALDVPVAWQVGPQTRQQLTMRNGVVDRSLTLLEVDTAPTAAFAKGRVRARLVWGADVEVEGEIDVTVCP